VGCWAHARRKFVDAVKVNPQDGAAIAMVTRMDALSLVDRHAREQQVNAEERAALRREHAQPWVDEIHSECTKLRAQLLPKSALGEAVKHTLNMRLKLKRCLDHAEVELSNNMAENSMRPVALGRKNWPHVGSAKASPKIAAIVSVVEFCRRLGLPVKGRRPWSQMDARSAQGLLRGGCFRLRYTASTNISVVQGPEFAP
jgi:hypothetical protein